MSLLEVRGLTAGYAGRPVLRDASFAVEPGEMAALLGRNGSGKTTLIRAVCGILPHGGTCRLDGTQLEGLSPRALAGLCAYVPQRSGLSIHISALETVLMGFNPRLGLLERPDADMRRQALEALAQVGLAEWAEEDYLALSEGQKRRCILARAMVSGGKLLVLDEPEGALDLPQRYRLMEQLRAWVARGERGALMALHDPELALNCCQRLLLLKDGRVCADLRPGQTGTEELERALSMVYGEVQLLRCRDRWGGERLVMLKEVGR